MNPRSLIVIVLMGVGALGSLGMIAGYALESDPELKDSVRFRADAAKEFAPRGVTIVALRRLPAPARGYELRVSLEADDASSRPEDASAREGTLAADLAEFLVRRHPDRHAKTLRVTVVPPASSWGWGESASEERVLDNVELQPIRWRVLFETRQRGFRADVAAQLAAEAVRVEESERRLEVDVRLSDEGASRDEQVSLSDRIEKLARARLTGFYDSLAVRILAGGDGDSAAVLFEMSYDRFGRRRSVHR